MKPAVEQGPPDAGTTQQVNAVMRRRAAWHASSEHLLKCADSRDHITYQAPTKPVRTARIASASLHRKATGNTWPEPSTADQITLSAGSTTTQMACFDNQQTPHAFVHVTRPCLITLDGVVVDKGNGEDSIQGAVV